MSRINKLRQMATKCIRKIPTVSVKSNYNVEGNLSITGKLLVNGEDFSKNIISSINGKTGDVRLVAGEGINLDLSKNSEIIISNSLAGTGVWRFEMVSGNGDIANIIENPKSETVYLVDMGSYIEAQIYDIETKQFKKLSTAEGEGDFDRIYNELDEFRKNLTIYEEKFDRLDEKLDTVDEKLEILNGVETRFDEITNRIEAVEKFDGKIGDLESQIGVISENLEEVTTNLGEVAELKDKIDNLDSQFDEITSNIENIETNSTKIERHSSLDEIINPSSNKIYIVPNEKGFNVGYIWNDESNEFETIMGGSSSDSPEIDLSDYVTKSELEDYVSDTELGNFVSKSELNDYNFATNSQLENYISKTEIEDYNYVTNSDLENYATKSDLSGYVTNSKLEETYATKEEIKNFATKSELGDFATKSDLDNYVTNTKLNDYATKSELSGYVTNSKLEEYATKEEIKNFATKSDLDSYATKSDLDDYVTKSALDETLTSLKEELTSTPIKIETPEETLGNAPNYVEVDFDENNKTYSIKTTEALEERLGNVDNNIDFIKSDISGLDERLEEYIVDNDDKIDVVKSDIEKLDKRIEELENNGIPGGGTGITENEVRDIVEDVLSARITTAYSTVEALTADIDILEENKVYWVNDKGTIEQYIKQGDKVLQISGGFNIKKESPEDENWTMPWSVDTEEIEGNLSELVDGSYLFDDYHNLRVFTGDTNNMTRAVEMFKGTKLEEFRGELSSLVTAVGMFEGCKLDLESIINIIDTLESYDDGKINHKLTIGYNPSISADEDTNKELQNLMEEGELKGWDINWQEWISW